MPCSLFAIIVASDVVHPEAMQKPSNAMATTYAISLGWGYVGLHFWSNLHVELWDSLVNKIIIECFLENKCLFPFLYI